MLLNEKLYIDKARRFADRVTREAGPDPEAAVERAFLIALARKPTSEERTAAVRFLTTRAKTAGGPKEALTDFCHAVLNLNEFVYVD